MSKKRTVIFASLTLVALFGVVLWLTLSVKVNIPTESKSQSNEKVASSTSKVADNKDAEQIELGRRLNEMAPPKMTSEWMEWYKGLTNDDRLSWALYNDSIKSNKALIPDRNKKVRMDELITPDKTSYRVRTIYNFKPLLRIQDNLPVRAMQAKIVRNSDGTLSTVFWARRARDAFQINWTNGVVSDSKGGSLEEGDSPVPEDLEADTGFAGGSVSRESWITYRVHDKVKKFDWKVKTTMSGLVVGSKYPMAFGLESLPQDPGAINLVWLDVKSEKVGRISLPSAPRSVHVIYKPELNALLIFDSGWEWMTCLDLISK